MSVPCLVHSRSLTQPRYRHGRYFEGSRLSIQVSLFCLVTSMPCYSHHSSGPKIHPPPFGAMTGVLPLLTVLPADAIVLVAPVVVLTPATIAITVATASTGKGICQKETVTPEMEGKEGDAAGLLTEGGALRQLTGGGLTIGTGVRGPHPWKMSKKISMIATGRGSLPKLPLTTIEPRTIPASVRIQSFSFLFLFERIRYPVSCRSNIIRVSMSCST